MQPPLDAAVDGLQVRRFDAPLERCKAELFDAVDAGVTAAEAGIADTGTLILRPGAGKPRTLSLVPPLHVAVLRARRLYPGLPAATMAVTARRSDMPTNLLLVTGPSKTADIQQAPTPEEANAIFLALARAHGADRTIKGKSMVSNEIEFNYRMAEQGVSCLDPDMGEYIVQLAGERPSHISMPAMHKTKEHIAALFSERIPETPYTEAVDELIAIGHRVLRNEFRERLVFPA